MRPPRVSHPSALRACARMHAGQPCRVDPRFRPPAPVGPFVELRATTRVDGVQAMGPARLRGAGAVEYTHDYAPGAGPTLAVDLGRARNNLVHHGGAYRVDERSGMIEDDEETMARRHHMRSRNPEGLGMALLYIGLALGATTILLDIVQSMFPATWTQNKTLAATLAVDALAIVGGWALVRKSPSWGIALFAGGVMDAMHSAWTTLGLKAKIQAWLHPAGTPATPPVTSPTSGLSGNLRELDDGRKRFAPRRTEYNDPEGIRVKQAA